MFTTTFQIRYVGLSLSDAGDIWDALPDQSYRDKIQSVWFDVMRESVNSGDIKPFRFHEWDPTLQTSKSIFYSDTAEQARSFRHRLMNNPNFMSMANYGQGLGHEVTLDSGIAPMPTAEKMAVDNRYQPVQIQ
jgi:hypothetical protein